MHPCFCRSRLSSPIAMFACTLGGCAAASAGLARCSQLATRASRAPPHRRRARNAPEPPLPRPPRSQHAFYAVLAIIRIFTVPYERRCFFPSPFHAVGHTVVSAQCLSPRFQLASLHKSY
eukprot:6187344-Pleurochrysis_carterae.AAC.1